MNLRPPRPERGALPGCATSRPFSVSSLKFQSVFPPVTCPSGSGRRSRTSTRCWSRAVRRLSTSCIWGTSLPCCPPRRCASPPQSCVCIFCRYGRTAAWLHSSKLLRVHQFFSVFNGTCAASCVFYRAPVARRPPVARRAPCLSPARRLAGPRIRKS